MGAAVGQTAVADPGLPPAVAEEVAVVAAAVASVLAAGVPAGRELVPADLPMWEVAEWSDRSAGSHKSVVALTGWEEEVRDLDDLQM